MYKTLLGDDGFNKGMKLYVERHDGCAVTCDDFRLAMSDANNVNLNQFENWYLQSGTPIITIIDSYDPIKKTYTLEINQNCDDTPGLGQLSNEKKPFMIPITIGLLSKITGKEILKSKVLVLKEKKETFVFENINESKPILSLLRNFSAPVKVIYDQQTDDDLAFLMSHDTDVFNRWDASNRLATKIILDIAAAATTTTDSDNDNNNSDSFANDINERVHKSTIPDAYLNAIRTCLKVAIDDNTTQGGDAALLSMTLQLPDLSK
jgi:aminopeptidase N